MEKQETNSEFLKKVKDFATELSKDDSSENFNRGYIIIAAETPQGIEKPDTEQIIAVGGNGFEIIKCIAELATQDSTKVLFKEGVKLGAIKTIAKALSNKD